VQVEGMICIHLSDATASRDKRRGILGMQLQAETKEEGYKACNCKQRQPIAKLSLSKK